MFSGVFDLSWLGYVVVTLCMTHVTIASVTIFLHRHQAHRALELGPLPSHFFRFWLWLTTGMVTKEWAAIHRKHHAKCETADDPHSPQIYGINRVLWGGVFLYVKEARNRETVERYGHGTPADWMERNIYTPWQKLGVVFMLAIDLTLFGPAGALIWAVQVAWIPFWAAGVINGIGHYWGYRNFAAGDASTNIFPIGIFIGGEELHNNHHTYATSAKLSNKWYEFDIGWLYIRILESLGMARVKKVAPTARLASDVRAVVDMETLQAVITNRYDVLARYVRSAKLVAKEELAKLKLDARESLLIRRMIGQMDTVSGAAITPDMQQRFTQLVSRSEHLKQIQLMRTDLEALWARSSATHDQLVKQLQDWIARAEASGIRQLEEFSLSLRRYAV